MPEILEKIADVLESRRDGDPQGSYVASLYAQGLDAMLKKVGEESIELLIAAKSADPGAVVRFHSRSGPITETAAGHAALSTGTVPARNGIIGNDWQHRVGDGWMSMYTVADSTSPIIGLPDNAALIP